MIKGITVKLHEKTQIGVDEFDAPVYQENEIEVDNVLVGEPSAEEIKSTLELYGSRIVYMLALPKGDTHEWKNADVEFFGRRFHVIGDITQGIEENIPLAWNKKVKVEAYG